MKTEKELDERIDKRVAVEVMGWKKSWNESDWTYDGEKTTGYSIDIMPRWEEWCPSVNMVHVYKMEKRIEELGLKEKYCEALAEILDNDEDSICPADLFKFIHADPHDKCLAALKTIEEKNEI